MTSETSDTAKRAPGWYPDPDDSDYSEVYWDGERWHGRRDKLKEPAPRLSWRRVKRFFSETKWLWTAVLPLIGTLGGAYLPRNFTRVRVLLGRERVRIVDLDFGAPVKAVTPRVVR
jgi:hypothetical protein